MRSRSLATLLVLLAATFVLLSPGATLAQEAWAIRSFHVDYVINPDGRINVTEEILVDFGRLERRGIIREVAVEYEYQPDPVYRRVVEVKSVRVDDGASPIRTETYREGNFLNIRIGDPNIYITGEQRYRITYVLEGALNPQDAWDEFYWNVTGNFWEVTIQHASATVTAPSIERTACFQGPFGGTEACSDTSGSGGTFASFETTRPQPPGSGLTVVVGLEKGSVQVPPLNLVRTKTPAEQVRDFIGIKPFSLAAAAFLAIAAPFGVARYWWLNGRDRWLGDVHYLTGQKEEKRKPLFARDTVVVEYTPPELETGRGRAQRRALRPAEIGTLLDERADTLDVTATIVDLAVRGYLRITEIPKKWLFGSVDYQIEQLKPADDDLLTYESVLHKALFKTGESVQMSDLKNEFYKDLARVKTSLYSQVSTKNKFFPKSPESMRALHSGIGTGLLLGGIGLSVALGQFLGAAIVGVPVAVAGLLLLIFSSAMAHRTGKGREMYRRCLGFREYMLIAETDRQRFYEEENIFEKYLPYAMVYGCVDRWARAFRDIEKQPGSSGSAVSSWYVSNRAFSAAAFSSTMNSFSSSMSSAIASTPGGSGGSGFSGGGSSGGGGGGGGGRSW